MDDVDEDLWWILVNCMMKDPEERFQTPGDLARALEMYSAGEPLAERDSIPVWRQVLNQARQDPSGCRA